MNQYRESRTTSVDQEAVYNLVFSPWSNDEFLQFGNFYLAGDVRGHGRRWLGVRVCILGDKARVVGGDAAEPMGSCRGHLQETVGRKMCQYTSNTQGDKCFWQHQTTCHNSRWAIRK